MASYNWSVTTSWVAYGPTGAAKLNIENRTGVAVEYFTGTSAPTTEFGGALRPNGVAVPVDLKAGERLYLRGATSTNIFGQDAG